MATFSTTLDYVSLCFVYNFLSSFPASLPASLAGGGAVDGSPASELEQD